MLRAVGLDARPVVANDPFFGRGGRVHGGDAARAALKYELVVPITSADKPTAIASCNYHLDHFGQTFGIKTADGRDRAHARASASASSASPSRSSRRTASTRGRGRATSARVLAL